MTTDTERRKALFDFNLLGIDDQSKIDQEKQEEIQQIKLQFLDFIRQVDNQTEEETDMYLKAVENITMGAEEKIVIEKKYLENIRYYVDAIIGKLDQLKQLGSNHIVSKQDYQYLKCELLESFFSLFGSQEDIENLNYAVRTLEEMQIIPPDSRYAVMISSPMGRWL